MSRKTVRTGDRAYVYYYCPTGKKHGCDRPVMVKESALVECVTRTVKSYVDNISSLEALLKATDAESINRALTVEYGGHLAENERKLEQIRRYRANLYESLTEGIITKTEYALQRKAGRRAGEPGRTEPLDQAVHGVLRYGFPRPEGRGANDPEHHSSREDGDPCFLRV